MFRKSKKRTKCLMDISQCCVIIAKVIITYYWVLFHNIVQHLAGSNMFKSKRLFEEVTKIDTMYLLTRLQNVGISTETSEVAG